MPEEGNDLEVKPAAGEAATTDAKAPEQAQSKPSEAATPMQNPEDKAPDAFEAKASGPQETNLLKGIVSTNTEPEEDILEVAPEVDMSLLQDVEPPKSVLLMVLKALSVVILVLGAGSMLFFSSQLSDVLDPVTEKLNVINASGELELSNTEIIALQTDLNFYRYMRLKAHLDRFSYYGDSYLRNYGIYNSQTASAGDKNDAEEEMVVARDQLKTAFTEAQEIYRLSFVAPIKLEEESELQKELLFQNELKEKLNAKAAELSGSADRDAKRAVRNYQQTAALVNKAQVKTLFLSTDFDELSDEELKEMVKKVNNLVVNDMSTIQKIKDQRIKWSDVMNEIELRTIAVDSYYSSGDLYEDVGGIRYNSYDFDSENRSIAISGETKLFNTLNFSLIVDLIDEINRSELFENAEMRSFTKTGSVVEGYKANLRLSLDLEGAEEESPVEDTPINDLPDLGIEI